MPWVFVGSRGDRQMTASTLAKALGKEESTAENMQEALSLARERTQKGDVIVVFGSFSAVEQCTSLAS